MPHALPRRRLLALTGAVAAPALLPHAAHAAWPDRALRIIVPFPAGGGLDLVGRVLAEALTPVLGQAVVVENRTGAGGAIGIEALSRAQPDGLTLAISSASSITLGPLLRPTPYEPLALTHVIRVVTSPFILVANRQTPYRDGAEFVRTLRERPDSVRFASAGIGTSTHLSIEWLNQKLGTRIEPIHYRGAAPALTDVSGGTADVLFSDVSAWPAVEQGGLRLLAVSSTRRWARSPDTPTIGELVPGIGFDNWYGIAAPAGLPEPIGQRLTAETMRALARPEVAARLSAIGFTPDPLPTEPFVAGLRAEVENWRAVLAAGNIRVD